jgi:hypothetical protein
MKSSKRALRRHHRQRMFRRALRIASDRNITDEQTCREFAQRWCDNLKKCSCYLCGNPRRHFRTWPVQQRRLLAAADGEHAEWM